MPTKPALKQCFALRFSDLTSRPPNQYLQLLGRRRALVAQSRYELSPLPGGGYHAAWGIIRDCVGPQLPAVPRHGPSSLGHIAASRRTHGRCERTRCGTHGFELAERHRPARRTAKIARLVRSRSCTSGEHALWGLHSIGPRGQFTFARVQSCKTELVQDDNSALIEALDAKKTRFLVPQQPSPPAAA